MSEFNRQRGELNLSQLLCVFPGKDYDLPLESLAGFDKLAEKGDPWQIEQLVDWIEPQTTCQYLIDHHGCVGLNRVLEGLARACAKHRVHMRDRVGSTAVNLGLERI